MHTDGGRSTYTPTEPGWALADVEALVVLSFGAPEGPEDIRPFLENVTRGRGIPPERLDEVGKHYNHFDGLSPLNELNREIIANVEAELARRGIKLPVYFGNRNWKPYANDVAIELAKAGVRRAVVFATSAWGGYSGCKQYDEDIAAMREAQRGAGFEPTDFFKVRQFFDHPTFVADNATAVSEAFARVPAQLRDEARLVFTAHSIPVRADEASGTPADGTLYSRQVAEAARLVAKQAGIEDYDLVWQSASGDGSVPWLEPDILDHEDALHAAGTKAMVICSVGFISDHMEVVWDLDHELADQARRHGMVVERAATVGPLPSFAAMVVDLIEESLDPASARHEGMVVSKGCSLNGNVCEPGCCPTRPRKLA